MNDGWLVAGWLGGVALLAALSWKWCLPARSVGPIVALAAVAGVLVGLWARGAGWSLIAALAGIGSAELVVYVGAILYRFYRDPERTPPSDPRAIVSPADGTVIYIRRVPAGGVLRSEKRGAQLVLEELNGSPLAAAELWQIGISMVFTDVHVNRAPIAGTVTLARHQPGKFLSLRIPEAVNLNERQTLVFDNGRFALALVQIASRLVRRIEAYVREGEKVARGQRIGMIKFGSQVDVFLPVAVAPELRVREGDVLVAGESILALSPVLAATIAEHDAAAKAAR
ncbi:MAG: phosphatidylserine decarboxylase [Verrucomicrobiae bacterium]|nr:phosphatidylserine decarboxylase [Verrucomicrobiae bacterium]